MADRVLRNFVGGRSADVADGRTAPLINPSTGEVFAEAPLSGEADVDAAMQAAQRAFEGWRDATPSTPEPGAAADRRRPGSAGRGVRRGREPRTPASRSA